MATYRISERRNGRGLTMVVSARTAHEAAAVWAHDRSWPTAQAEPVAPGVFRAVVVNPQGERVSLGKPYYVEGPS